MRIKSTDDLNKLGPYAKRQIEDALKLQGGFKNANRASTIDDLKSTRKELKESQPQFAPVIHKPSKKDKPSRVMRTAEGLLYCPWPSTDPFVAVYQRLESRYGAFSQGGLLVTELIVDGGTKDWRFDFAIISPIIQMTLSCQGDDTTSAVWVGSQHVLIEADGFGFHRSKDAFKNDRAKQTHALKQGFVVKRITNEDARTRLDELLRDIDTILSHQRIYNSGYTIQNKGKTQSTFTWSHNHEPPHFLEAAMSCASRDPREDQGQTTS